MSDAVRSFNYPWAAAPDIIRSHQKDAYVQSVLLTQLSTVIRSLYGTRSEHKWAPEASLLTELLYLALTTLLGNRTLGEEYCDIVQVEHRSHALPSLARRSGYILSSVLLPYSLTKFLPALRKRLRAKLQSSLTKAHRRPPSNPENGKHRFQEYCLKHLDALTSPAPLYSASLAVFYFSGAYYQLSKRVFGLRYVFTRQPTAGDQRSGYEVLGFLLLVQTAVQGYLHLRDTYQHIQTASTAQTLPAPRGTDSFPGGGDVGTETTPLSTPDPNPHDTDPAAVRKRVSRVTHTPLAPAGPRYDLKHRRVMPWIEGRRQRTCTLCLEPMRDPAATTCGHVFCWPCVTDWLREQPMCPLCRQTALAQHVLPLRG